MANITTPPITSAGIGSGLDVTGLVTSLMNAESVPLNTLNAQKSTDQAKISAFGSIKNGLSQFQTSLQKLSDPKNIQTITASSSDSSIVTASGTSSAATGNYALQVNQLAQSQKLAAAGQTSLSTAIGTGTVSFEFGTINGGINSHGKYTGASFTGNGLGIKTVTIDDAHNSLSGIRDAINAAGIGITASIVNDGSNSPYRLTLSNSKTGETQSMKILATNVSGDLASLLNQDPAGSQNLTETLPAQNAKFTLDGISVSKTTNSVSDAIPGVTLNLLKTNTGSPTQITVSRDTNTLSTNINSFITQYNNINSSLKSLTSYDMTNKKGAVLYGDSSVRSILSQMKGIITGSLPSSAGSLIRLNQIGLSFQKDGTLSLDQTKLTDAINNHFDDVASLFASSANATDTGISYLGSTTNTKTGTYAINISQLATQAQLSGTSNISGSTPIALDSTNNSLSVTLNGLTATIQIPEGIYSDANTLSDAIVARINGVKSFSDAGASAGFSSSGSNISFHSNLYGAGSQIQLSSSDPNNTLLTALLGNSPSNSFGTHVAGTINGVAAHGFGQTLTGATGDPSESLKIQINSGATGNRGSLNYTQGFSYQLNQLTTNILGNNGLIANRTNGINSSIKQLDDKITRLQSRLDTLKQNYTKQFNALDQTMSKMNSTSSYLTQQLAALAKSSG